MLAPISSSYFEYRALWRNFFPASSSDLTAMPGRLFDPGVCSSPEKPNLNNFLEK
jgi:hypothetical protein